VSKAFAHVADNRAQFEAYCETLRAPAQAAEE